MNSNGTDLRLIAACGVIRARANEVFELIADPARQPEWDGNGNLASAASGQRVQVEGDVFDMNIQKVPDCPTCATSEVRRNRVTEFVEGRVIAWKPSVPGSPEPGHEWKWVLIPQGDATVVVHIYDWSTLTDESRLERARATTAANLLASINRLKALAED